MRFDSKRLIISLVLIIGVQYLANFVIANVLGIEGIWYFIVSDLFVAFLFGFINYPGRMSLALKDPSFYRYVCIIFLVLFGIDLIL